MQHSCLRQSGDEFTKASIGLTLLSGPRFNLLRHKRLNVSRHRPMFRREEGQLIDKVVRHGSSKH